MKRAAPGLRFPFNILRSQYGGIGHAFRMLHEEQQGIGYLRGLFRERHADSVRTGQIADIHQLGAASHHRLARIRGIALLAEAPPQKTCNNTAFSSLISPLCKESCNYTCFWLVSSQLERQRPEIDVYSQDFFLSQGGSVKKLHYCSFFRTAAQKLYVRNNMARAAKCERAIKAQAPLCLIRRFSSTRGRPETTGKQSQKNLKFD